MAKKRDGVVRISRKGLFIWSALVLLLAGWMFLLGILVGRGYTPADLGAGKLEQELQSLKAAMTKKEQAKVEAHAGSNGTDKPELGFYKALKENQTRHQIKMPPKKRSGPVPAPVPVKPSAPAKSKPAPKKASLPEQRAKATPPAKPTPSKGHFTIQVAAVKVPANAEKLVGDLRKKGYSAYQVRVTIPGKGEWHRIRVGAFEDRAIADRMLKKLKAEKINGVIVNTN